MTVALKNFIGGEWIDGSGLTRNINPSNTKDVVGEYFPHAMSIKMLLKPLDLAPATQRVAQSTLEALARRLVA